MVLLRHGTLRHVTQNLFWNTKIGPTVVLRAIMREFYYLLPEEVSNIKMSNFHIPDLALLVKFTLIIVSEDEGESR